MSQWRDNAPLPSCIAVLGHSNSLDCNFINSIKTPPRLHHEILGLLVFDSPILRKKNDKVGGEFLTKEIWPDMFSSRILDNTFEKSNLGLDLR